MNYDIVEDIRNHLRRGGSLTYDRSKYPMPNWMNKDKLERIRRLDEENGY